MNNLDTPLDAIKEAEASFAKLTMEDKLSHPPPDIVSLCTLNIKRLRLSNTMLLPTETAVLNDYQQIHSSKDDVSQPPSKYKVRSFRVNDPKRQLKKMQKIKQLERLRKRIVALKKETWNIKTLVWKKDYELYRKDFEIINLKQTLSHLNETPQTLMELCESCEAKSKERVIIKPKSLLARLERKASKAST